MAVTQRIVWLPLGVRVIQYTDIDATREVIRFQRRRLSDLTPFLKGVANIMRADFRRQFASAGDPKWTPLAASTIRQKARLGYPRLTAKGNIPRRLVQQGQFGAANILIRTGRLRDAWSRSDSADHYEKIDPKQATVRMGPKTDTLPYAKTMQTGATIHLRGRTVVIPARPVRMTEQGFRSIVRFSEGYFKGEGASNGQE
jgi:phage gpG-like protein